MYAVSVVEAHKDVAYAAVLNPREAVACCSSLFCEKTNVFVIKHKNAPFKTKNFNGLRHSATWCSYTVMVFTFFRSEGFILTVLAYEYAV